MRHQAAFTLIELLVVITIIGVLSAIAIPAYSNHVLRGQLTEAIATLSDMRVKMEQYYNDNRFYSNGTNRACAPGTVAPLPTPTPSDRFTYECPAEFLTANTYKIVATGKQDARAGGIKDFQYSIDQDNKRQTLKLPSGWDQTNVGANSTCWVLKSDGTC
jgi:type IV pilus assembly protein PilE